jgi:hypothetical protein
MTLPFDQRELIVLLSPNPSSLIWVQLTPSVERIENPTVEGIAERMGIPRDILNTWLNQDAQFREELTRLKDFQTNDPIREGTEFDYFIHSSGIQFILDETKKRYTV